jgi:hypothetical protein
MFVLGLTYHSALPKLKLHRKPVDTTTIMLSDNTSQYLFIERKVYPSSFGG